MTEHTQQTATIFKEMSDALISLPNRETTPLTTAELLQGPASWHWHCSVENDVGVAEADLNALEQSLALQKLWEETKKEER